MITTLYFDGHRLDVGYEEGEFDEFGLGVIFSTLIGTAKQVLRLPKDTQPEQFELLKKHIRARKFR